jgi:hypothetical protein
MPTDSHTSHQEVGHSVVVATTVATLMIAQQIASKAIRDGLFLTAFDVSALPRATLVAAMLSFAAALVVGRLLSTRAPARVVPALFGIHGGLLLVEAALVEAAPRGVAAALYLHVAVFGGAVVSGFWSVVNERFDAHTARRVMSTIAAGATLGGLLGGLATWVGDGLAPRTLLSGLALSSLLCAGGVRWIAPPAGDSGERSVSKSESVFAGVRVLFGEALPRRIGGVVFLVAALTTLVDYVFKAGVVNALQGEDLVGFFAAIYTGTGLATFVL